MLRPLVVEEVDEGQPVTWPALVTERVLVDRDGVLWRRRGGQPDGRRLRRLLGDPEVRVVHNHLGTQTEVPPGRREAFWAAALEAMRVSDHSSFEAAEFTNDRRARLLVLTESC